MAIPIMEDDVEIIQKLGTYPNRDNGLSAEELKKRFDAAAVLIKSYLNGILVPAIQGVEDKLGTGDFVSYLVQSLTPSQQSQARANIDAMQVPMAKEVTRDEFLYAEQADFSVVYGRNAYIRSGALEWLQSSDDFDFHIVTQINGETYDLTKADCEMSIEETGAGKIWNFMIKAPDGVSWVYPLIVANGVNPVTKEPEDCYGFTYFGVTPGGDYPNLWFYRVTTTERKLNVVTGVNGVEADENGNVTVDTMDEQAVQTIVEDKLRDINPVLTVNGVEPDENGNVAVKSGLSEEAKSLLITVLRNATYHSDQSANITALETALASSGGDTGGGDGGETEVTLVSISATYTGGDVAVGTAVTALSGITVKATYSDGSTATVTEYILSGEIAEGSNTVTVEYQGKTTTFTVIGVEAPGTVVPMTQMNFGQAPTLYSDDGSTSVQTSTQYGWRSDTVFDQDTRVHIEITLSSSVYRAIRAGSYDSAGNTAYYVEDATESWPAQGGKKYEYDYTVRAGYHLCLVGINAIDESNILTVTY